MIKFLNKLFGSCLYLMISIIVCGIVGVGLSYWGMSLIAGTGLVVICGWIILVIGLLMCLSGIIDLIILFVKSILGKKWWYLAIDILFIVLYVVACWYLISCLTLILYLI